MANGFTGGAGERALALLEIRELAGRYAVAFDARDERRMLQLWAPRQQQAALPDLDRSVMIDTVIPAWAGAGPSVMHIGTQTAQLLTDDTASGLAYCLVRIELRGELIEQSVLYRDCYARSDEGEWQFVTRRHHLFCGRSLGSSPWLGAAANWPRHQVGAGDLPSVWDEVLASTFY